MASVTAVPVPSSTELNIAPVTPHKRRSSTPRDPSNVKTSVDLHVDLHARVKAVATKAGVSMNGFIVEALEVATGDTYVATRRKARKRGQVKSVDRQDEADEASDAD